MIRRLLAVAVVAGACACAPATAAAVINDDMAGPNPQWQITSGALTFDQGVARTDSPVFRMNSTDYGFDNVTITVRMAVDSVEGGPDWSGAHIWVRHQSQYQLYAVSVDREDGNLIIKKKCQGGPDQSNGGTYYDLTPPMGPAPIPYGDWQNVVVSATDQSDGSVSINANRDGHAITAVDHGVGCPPLHGGAVGVRSDNAVIRIDKIVVQQS